MKEEKIIINFTPTGMIPTKGDTPFVPISTQEIVEEVHAAFELGITLVHLHARDGEGTPTHEVAFYEPIIWQLRKHCPDLIICVSTSGRGRKTDAERAEVLSLKPDMASLTLSSLNFLHEASTNAPRTIQHLLSEMKKNGVIPELECFDAGMINVTNFLIRKGLLPQPHYFNLIVGNISNAQFNLTTIDQMIAMLPADALWSLGGIGSVQLEANMLGILLKGGVRVGLEDNLWFDAKKETLATNRMLLLRIHKILELFNYSHLSSTAFASLGFRNYAT